jgi:hypothetical protein
MSRPHWHREMCNAFASQLTHVLPHISTSRFAHLCRSRPQRLHSLAATHRGFAFYVAFPESSIPDRDVFYVADPISSIVSRSLPLDPTATRRGFTGHVAAPRSLHSRPISRLMTNGSSRKSGFDVFVGSESFLLACMRNGVVGTISVFSRSSLAMSVSLGECLAGSR